MILDDIRRAIERARAAKRGKPTIRVGGEREPRLVVVIGAWDAYAAARAHDADVDHKTIGTIDLMTFDGLEVERRGGGMGVDAVWRV